MDHWQDMLDEIEMAKSGLLYFCNLIQAGKRQGGGREFERQIHARLSHLERIAQSKIALNKELVCIDVAQKITSDLNLSET